MLIVSQNKKVLIRPESVFSYYIDHGNVKGYSIKAHGNFKGSFVLGEYSTEQKAISALSELMTQLTHDSYAHVDLIYME